jgi:hypothetical protein
MKIFKRLLILIAFLGLFVTLAISLSIFAGQMPNRLDIIPKNYQSKIQLTFQAGYNQVLQKAADLLGAADGQKPAGAVTPEPTPIQPILTVEQPPSDVESVQPEPPTDSGAFGDPAYPDPLPDQDSPYYHTIRDSVVEIPGMTKWLRDHELIQSIEGTERGAALEAALGSILDSKAIDAIKAIQTDVFPPNIEANFFIHLPAIYMLYPRPPGYDENVARRIQAVDIERYEESIRNLVENYSPRNPGSFQVIINFQNCVQSMTQFDKHNLLRALEDVQKRFEALGLTVTQEPVPGSDGTYNLVATKPAVRQDGSDEVIELGAHLDTPWVEGQVLTPGASDNAAGVAGLLEIAATLKNYPNRHPWRFVVFVGAEAGNRGSLTHVELLKDQPFMAALIMDGIGWSEISPEYMTCIFSNDEIPYTGEISGIFNEIRETYGIPAAWRSCKAVNDFSDQGSYWKSGLPAVLSVGGLPYENPNLNQCSDNMTSLDLYNAYYTVQENLGVLLILDQE